MPLNPDDLIIWPCGTWCHRHELEGYSHKSDDYQTISVFTAEYDAFFCELIRK